MDGDLEFQVNKLRVSNQALQVTIDNLRAELGTLHRTNEMYEKMLDYLLDNV